MANIIASGVTAASSAEFTLAAGESATLFISHASLDEVNASALAKVQIKSAAGTWTTVGTLRYGQPALVLTGAGTYRVHRPVTTGDAISVEKV